MDRRSTLALSLAPSLAVVLALVGIPRASGAADPDRGRLLYENHCTSCHESTVHIRHEQEARSLEAVRAQVMRWQAAIALQWGADEVGDVVQYLNAAWYHFP